MLESLHLTPNDAVLEVGTGSGYVTALLAELAAQVFSIERHAALADRARNLLSALGYTNVRVFTGDGTLGLPACAPFDAIIVSAAALHVPQSLLSQLRDGGRMILPVGSPDSQQLQFIRMQSGEPIISLGDPVRFVPLIYNQD
jgi:protein-L-isoaspartate(D-aspartate) O-methyltransferase